MTLAAIYGPNASGKSNVVASLAWLKFAIDNSLRLFEDSIPIEPFAFGKAAAEPSDFSIELSIDGVRFEYLLELKRSGVIYEGLFHYPQKKRRRIFERDGQELTLQRGLGSLSGTRELLTDTTLALSAARRFNEPLVNMFAYEIQRMRVLGHTPFGQRRFGVRRVLGGSNVSPSTMRWFDDDQLTLFAGPDDAVKIDSREQALALLQLADLGIEDVMIEEVEVKFADSDSTSRQRRIKMLHRAGDRIAPL